jgi:hypothetical protein
MTGKAKQQKQARASLTAVRYYVPIWAVWAAALCCVVVFVAEAVVQAQGLPAVPLGPDQERVFVAGFFSAIEILALFGLLAVLGTPFFRILDGLRRTLRSTPTREADR